jgi:hypothetical protein
MRKEKFTQGEWEIEEREMNIRDTHMFGFAIMTKKHRICMCETDDDRNIPQMKANAALIAAAPEMYKFIAWLGSVEGQCAILTKDPEIVRKAHAILKMARGEE